MRHAAWVLILGLLPAAGPVAGEIIVDEAYTPYTPIVASLDAGIPEGARVDGGWDVDDGAVLPAGPGFEAAHVWAGPGRHTVRFQGVWLQTRGATIDGETVQILQDFGFIRDQATFTVEGGDGPDPPPPPPPENRWGIIVEETGRRTPEQAALWSRATQATTLNELMIVDQDSRAASLEPYQTAAAEFVRTGGVLPALVVVSSADGSVVDVVECPGSVAEIKKEVGLDE